MVKYPLGGWWKEMVQYPPHFVLWNFQVMKRGYGKEEEKFYMFKTYMLT